MWPDQPEFQGATYLECLEEQPQRSPSLELMELLWDRKMITAKFLKNCQSILQASRWLGLCLISCLYIALRSMYFIIA